MKKRLFIQMFSLMLSAGLLTSSASLFAQDLPRIIQPSPETSALFRFQNYPMDYSTGLPQINIPIYEIKSGDLSVPISISYHASGRRVYDQDGPIAAGWSLNAGGMISRTVYGAVDFGTAAGTFKFPYPFNTTNLSNSTTLPYLENIMHYNDNPDDATPGTWTDGEYDMFSYSFGDHSGKFFFKDNNNVKTAALLPYKPYIITPIYNSIGLFQINIVDDKGTLYEFSGDETTLQLQSPIETVPATTGFVLTKITSADKSQIITFTYTGFVQTRKTISQSILFNDNEVGLPGFPNDIVTEGPTSLETTSQSPYQVARLTEIDFNQGKVLFNLIDSDKVDNIKITDNNNNVVKTIQLNRSTMNTLGEIGYTTSKLDAIVFKDNAGAAAETYSFQYYPNPSVPGQQDNTILNVRYRDWWGFYNASGVHDMIPYYTNLNWIAFNGVNNQNNFTIGNPSANREPNLLGLEAGVLKKIIYPTGGSTEFVYEVNKYWSYTTSQSKNGPGLRVAQMKSDDNNGNISYKTFAYGNNESGYGTLDMEPDITNMAVETIYNHYSTGLNDITYSYRSRVFNSDFISSLSELGERPVIYNTVTEYNGTPANNIGKIVYTYDYNGWAAGGMPALENLTIIKKHIPYFNYWNNPSLLSQSVYKNIPVNNIPNYTIKKQLTNSYSATTTETVSALHVQRVHILPRPYDGQNNERVHASPPVYEEPYAAIYANPLINIYTYAPYQIPVGYKNLSSSTETVYNDDGSSIVNTTAYTYNSHQYISQRSVNTSDAQTLNTQINYPFDNTGVPIYSQMVSLNMLDYPIEQNQSKNTTPLSGVRTNYYNFGSTNPNIYPQTVDVKKGGGTYETRLRYLGYDSYGNPASVSKENGILNSYIWDYNKTYPIAEVKNANTNDIAYTSFEADGNGGWTGVLTYNIATDINGITGSKYYGLTSAGLSKTGLTSTNTYIVSYWSKSGQFTVNGTSASGWPKNLRTVTINGVNWVNWEHKVSGVSSITVSGTGYIDELRLYPANAQMSTYTYTPLIGVTSQTDLNNKVTYYEYDAFGRLKLIRDINKNIIKTFSYKENSTTY